MHPSAAPSRPPRASTRWLLLVFLPIGFGTWVPIVAGVRARRSRWIAYGIAIVVGAVIGLTLPDAEDGELTDAAGVLLFGTWFAGIGWWLSCREAYAVRAGAAGRREEHDARIDMRESDRRRALRLARTDPAAAVRRGVGRPDLPDADHGWVVDVNHAPAGVIRTLPGIDEETARRVVATREEIGLFSSVEDLVFVLDLPADRIGRLRELAVALPA